MIERLQQFGRDLDRYLINGENYERAVVLTVFLVGGLLGFLALKIGGRK